MARAGGEVTGGWRGSWPFVVAAVVLVGTWSALWFLCDDAFISFRYVGNWFDGHGLVWNRAPWQPVEGYSNFLWVVLLGAVWWVAGVLPPQSANWLALLAALGSLWLVSRFLRQRGAAPALQLAVLVGIAAHPTFATWASSGLETALFGVAAVGWTLAACAAPGQRVGCGALATFAAIAALTRPDGMLLVPATMAVLAAVVWREPAARWGVVGRAWPLLLPFLHVGWRRAYYGEWLPNTYYAKVVAAWPESGLRYLYCFAVEHGLWWWLPLVWWGLWRALRAGGLRTLVARLPAVFAVATWLVFVGYYTLVVGGDHFGFRPFAHLVPLMVLALPFACGVARPRLPVVASWGFLLVGGWFGWWHEWALRAAPADGFVRAAVALPAPLGSLYVARDRCQAWLRLRYVALPRALHAQTCADLQTALPERAPGLVAGRAPGQRGVYRTVAAGVVGWVLADVDVVDVVGLNDWVVARQPARPTPPAVPAAVLAGLFPGLDRNADARLDAGEIAAFVAAADVAAHTGVVCSPTGWTDLLLALGDADGDGALQPSEYAAVLPELQNDRHMAHERAPPVGYVEALRPNITFDGRRFALDPAVVPLGDDELRAVEARFRSARGR